MFLETIITGAIIYFATKCWVFLFPVLASIFIRLRGLIVDWAVLELSVFFLIVIIKSGTINSIFFMMCFFPVFTNLHQDLFESRERAQTQVWPDTPPS